MSNMNNFCVLTLAFWICAGALHKYKGLVVVDYDCGSLEASNASVTVRADHPVRVYAICKGDRRTEVLSQDGVTHILYAKYNGSLTTECVFQKVVFTNLYTLELRVGYRDASHGPGVESFFSRYTITCTFDNFVSSVSIETEIDNGENVKLVNDQHNMGGQANLNITLDVVNKGGDPVKEELSWDREIRLQASLISGQGSIKALSCEAANSETAVPLLIAGCGTGTLFPINSGFVTTGDNVFSPFFDPFRLRGGQEIQFRCDFTYCSNSCDGDSCSVKSRKKRDVNEYRRGTIVTIFTDPGFLGASHSHGSKRYRRTPLLKHLMPRCPCDKSHFWCPC